MTTMTHDAGKPALIDRLVALLRLVVDTMAPPAPIEEEDIDWEDGEPDEETLPG